MDPLTHLGEPAISLPDTCAATHDRRTPPWTS